MIINIQENSDFLLLDQYDRDSDGPWVDAAISAGKKLCIYPHRDSWRVWVVPTLVNGRYRMHYFAPKDWWCRTNFPVTDDGSVVAQFCSESGIFGVCATKEDAIVMAKVWMEKIQK